MNDIEALGSLGLSRSEAKVYLTLLKNGPMNSGRIVALSRQHVSVVYYSVQRLIEKGMLGRTRKGRFEEYFVTDPQVFLDRIDEIGKYMREKVPDWKRQAELEKDRVTVEVFEGTKGVFNLFTNLVTSMRKSDELMIFSVREEYQNQESLDLLAKINSMMGRMKVRVRMVCSESQKPDYYAIEDPRYLKSIGVLKLRFVPFEFPQGVSVVGDSIVFISLGEENRAVKIRDRKLARHYAKFFNDLYEKGDPYRKK